MSRQEIIELYLNEYKRIMTGTTADKIEFFNDLIGQSHNQNETDLKLFFEGNIDLSKKQYGNALEKYQKTLKLNNNFAYAWTGIGNVYLEQKDYDKAIEAYLKSIELDSNNIFSWNGLGFAYWRKTNYDKATEALLKSMELDSKVSYTWSGLGNIYFDQNNYEKAIEAQLKALELNNKNEFAWNGLGNVYLEQKNYDMAKEAYQKAIELNVNFAICYNNFAILFARLNDLVTSIIYYKKAIDIFKSEGDTYWLSVTENNLKIIIDKINAESAISTVRSMENIDDPLSQVLSETKQFEDTIFNNQKAFQSFVEQRVVRDDELIYLKVLRRWNSYTPIVADNYHISKGGGYFLKINGKGIVIVKWLRFLRQGDKQ